MRSRHFLSKVGKAAGVLAPVLAAWIGSAAAQPLPPCAHIQLSGMVAWYPLDEPSLATVVFDVAGFNNWGAPQPGPVGPIGPTSGPFPVAGKVVHGPGPGALYFYGGHMAAVAPHPHLDFGTGDFSIDAWIRPVDVGQTVGGFITPIVDKLDTTPPNPAGFAFYLEGDTGGSPPHPSRLKLRINGATFASNGTIPFADPLGNTGPWTHVAVTVSRSGPGPLEVKFYINGSLDLPAQPAPPPAASVTNSLFMWIGETRVTGPRGEIAIDELEIFNRVLGAQEVLDIYNAAGAGKCRETVSILADVNQAAFAAGQMLIAAAGVANPGIAGVAADFYLGVLRPDGLIVFLTASGGFAGIASIADPAAFPKVAAGVPLAGSFEVGSPNFFSYQWTGTEPHGTYYLFLYAVVAGALDDGVVTEGEVLGFAIAPFAFP
jgi:hypothetical protein